MSAVDIDHDFETYQAHGFGFHKRTFVGWSWKEVSFHASFQRRVIHILVHLIQGDADSDLKKISGMIVFAQAIFRRTWYSQYSAGLWIELMPGCFSCLQP